MANGDSGNYTFFPDYSYPFNLGAPSFEPVCDITATGQSLQRNVDLISEKNGGEADTGPQIRCVEQAKGGIKYELVLYKQALRYRKFPSIRRPAFLVEGIPSRFRNMEERRAVLEAQKMNFGADPMNGNKEKGEINNSWIRKMESNKESRDAHLKSIQDKVMKIHDGNKYGESFPIKDFVMDDLIKKVDSAILTKRIINSSLKERFEKINQTSDNIIKRLGKMKECKGSRKNLDVSEKEMLQEIRHKVKEHENFISDIVEKTRSTGIAKTKGITENYTAGAITMGNANIKDSTLDTEFLI